MVDTRRCLCGKCCEHYIFSKQPRAFLHKPKMLTIWHSDRCFSFTVEMPAILPKERKFRFNFGPDALSTWNCDDFNIFHCVPAFSISPTVQVSFDVPIILIDRLFENDDGVASAHWGCSWRPCWALLHGQNGWFAKLNTYNIEYKK